MTDTIKQPEDFAAIQAARKEIEDRQMRRNVMRELEAERRKDARLEKIGRWPRGTRWLALVVAEALDAPRWAAGLFIWIGFCGGFVAGMALFAIIQVSHLK